MLTKRKVCEQVIKEFEDKNGGLRVKESDIFSSSRLAVAMGYLGLIKDPELKAYCASRDGVLNIECKSEKGLSFREFLKSLPEEAKDGK